MNPQVDRPFRVPGALRLKYFLLSAAAFTVLDLWGYWATTGLFPRPPQPVQVDRRPCGPDEQQRLTALNAEFARAAARIEALEQNLATLKKTAVERYQFERLKREVHELRAILSERRGP